MTLVNPQRVSVGASRASALDWLQQEVVKVVAEVGRWRVRFHLHLLDAARVVEREGGCVVWGGAINLAPADDMIINVEHPLSVDAEGQLVASIMAKKGSVGSSHVLIDIPVGPGAKITTYQQARRLKRLFELKIPLLMGDGPWTERIRSFREVLGVRDRLLSEVGHAI